MVPVPDAPVTAPGRLSGRVRLKVSTEVPAPASQRVVAQLGALGLDVRAEGVTPDAVFAGSAEARLFVWAPEVAEPYLALAELADLAPVAVAAHDTLALARSETDSDRRRLRLVEAAEALRAARVLIALARLPVAFQASGTVHGLRTDLAGRVSIEDVWVEP
jgi:hypothetical protein